VNPYTVINDNDQHCNFNEVMMEKYSSLKYTIMSLCAFSETKKTSNYVNSSILLKTKYLWVGKL